MRRIGDYFWTLASLGMIVLVAIRVGVTLAAAMVGIIVLMPVILHRPEVLREGIFVFAIAGFFVGYVVTGEAKAKLDFYVVAAQIVPALFIALAVEIQAFMRHHRGEDRRPALVVAVALVLAEVESLSAVAAGDRDEASFALVVGALVAAAIGLVLPVVLASSEQPAAREPISPPHGEHWRMRLADWVALALLLLAGRRRG